jgi:GDPmannose 4,6-dehydratase
VKRALVSGITGQDGSYLAELLLKKDYLVYGLARHSASPNYWRLKEIEDQITIIEADLLDLPSLVWAVKVSAPDEIYNLASQSFVPASWEQPVFTQSATALGPLNMLEAIRTVDPEIKFYQASSSEMFGMAKECPQNEETPLSPRSIYASSKTFAHNVTTNYREHYGLFASQGILFNHESPRRGIEFVTRKITDGVARIVEGLSENLALGNLDPLRDWGYAGDYVEAMWSILQQDKPGEWVIGTGETHSVEDFVRLAFECVGLDWHDYVVQDARYMRPFSDIPRLQADPRKAYKDFGWYPQTRFEDLVRMMVNADIKRLHDNTSIHANAAH